MVGVRPGTAWGWAYRRFFCSEYENQESEKTMRIDHPDGLPECVGKAGSAFGKQKTLREYL